MRSRAETTVRPTGGVRIPRPASAALTAQVAVMIVEGDVLTRDGMKAVIGRHREMRLVAEVDDMATAMERLPLLRPDVVFAEAWLASENEGAAIRQMLACLPAVKIMAFGMGRREEEIWRVLNAGGAGYLIRNAIPADLMTAIRCARSDRPYVPAAIQQMVNDRRRRPALTPRERGVLELLAQARSNATIAAVLGISCGTVKLHVKSILAKLGVEDRAEAALIAIERGFCPAR